jgi:hypothetical protein
VLNRSVGPCFFCIENKIRVTARLGMRNDVKDCDKNQNRCDTEQFPHKALRFFGSPEKQWDYTQESTGVTSPLHSSSQGQ